MIDGIDSQILTILQVDARTSNAEIARRVGLAPSAVFERVKKLEERRVLQSCGARLEPHALGLGLLAFVFVRSDDYSGTLNTATRLAAFPEVLEVHHVAGEDCYLVKVRVANAQALGQLLREGFGAIKTLRATRSTIVLESIKETQALPLPKQANANPVKARSVEAKSAKAKSVKTKSVTARPAKSVSSRKRARP
ncbi:MAG: Lrp/AsnC family transcriptional regulator [Thermoanaerobaculia bacterium]